MRMSIVLSRVSFLLAIAVYLFVCLASFLVLWFAATEIIQLWTILLNMCSVFIGTYKRVMA